MQYFLDENSKGNFLKFVVTFCWASRFTSANTNGLTSHHQNFRALDIRAIWDCFWFSCKGCYIMLYSISTLHEIGNKYFYEVCNLNVYILKPHENLHRRHQTNEWDDQFFFSFDTLYDRLCWYNISVKPTKNPLPWKMISSTLSPSSISVIIQYLSPPSTLTFIKWILVRYFFFFRLDLLPISSIFSLSSSEVVGCVCLCVFKCVLYILIWMKPHILSARRTIDMTRVPKCGTSSPSQTMNWIHNDSQNESQ